MPVAPESVLKDLKSNKYAPVYFLQGEEPYYIDKISDYIEANALKEHEKGFNQIIMYGQDAPMSVILNNARRYPMMSERQVVIVKEAQNIPDFTKENAEKMFGAYVSNPLPSTILVFNYKFKKLDARKSQTKQIEKFAVCVESKKLYDNQVPDWVTKYVNDKGFKVSPKTTLLISDFIGNNLERISNEIDKLLINLNPGEEITPDLVQKYIGISKEFNVFELQKALTTKDIVKANQIINYFAANPKNNPVIPIISSLFSYFTKLLLAHHSKDKSEKGLALALSVNPFFVKDYLAGVRNYPLVKVISIIHFIKTADLQSKGVESTSISEGEIMKELVYKILH
ncbi:MAG TPA: DNA polymerase III subunit delta [Cytophagales bacterium]|nr:DNA polymerase III subunit delta [Cytophagales bacterium]